MIEPENAASLRMMEKLGFTLLEETFLDGKTMKRFVKY
jgi:RimJ/RimL family protein N-acetyltransferase